MKIALVVIGKTDASYIVEAIRTYQERLVHYIPFELEVIPDIKNVKNLSESQQKEKEGEQILKLLEPSYVSGLTVLGGEPMEYVNQKELLPFLKKVKENYPKKTIWCYTGYVYEKDLLGRMIPKWKITKEILELIDVLVDGPFIEEQKDITLLFRGSANQRLIDVPQSLAAGEVILWEPQD